MNTIRECILVCLSSSPSNQTVIQSAIKMAEAYHAELIALYVEANDYRYTSDQERLQLEMNRKAAVKGGATYINLVGEDIAMLIAQYARVCHATKLVIGRPNEHGFWFFQKDISQQLILMLPDIEMYMIPSSEPTLSYVDRPKMNKWSARDFGFAMMILFAATFLGLCLEWLGFTDVNIITVYIVSVMFVAYFTEGYYYGFIASIAGVMIFNFLFTEPKFTFVANDKGYPVTFFVMFVASFLTSSLTARSRTEAKSNAQKAYRTEILLTASRNLQHADSETEILHETATQILKLTGNPVVLYSVKQEQLVNPVFYDPRKELAEEEEENFFIHEKHVAEYVFQHNEQAGASTKTHPQSNFWYLAIRGQHQVHAVAGIAVNANEPIRNFEKSLLLALLGECGVALEKQQLRDNQARLRTEAQREKTRADLLRAISHDLRTPLTSISGNAELLTNQYEMLDNQQRTQLFSDIYEDSSWLIRLVENLLAITRMDNKSVSLNLKPEFVVDVIEEAVSHSARRAQNHILKVEHVEEFLMARMEASLIVQVLVNLVDNAVKYTPHGSKIKISAKRSLDNVLISVCDNGPGIPVEQKSRLFEMYFVGSNYRSDTRRGLGLGLALCKTIVSAHGGEIWVSDHEPQGTCFTFSLKAEEVKANE